MTKYDVLLEAETWERRVFENKHDCINDWLRSKHSTGKSRRTLNAYSRVACEFFHEFVPETAPADVSVGDVESYVLELEDRDASQNTKRRYVESLSSFYTWALFRPRFEDVTGNPAKVVLEELPKEKKPRPESATWANGKAIVQQLADPRDKAIAAVLAKTGARVREVLSLTADDLLLDDGFVRFEDRKGGTTTVNPVDEETIRSLRQVQVVSSGVSPYVFAGIRGTRIRRERVRRVIRQAAVDAGVMESLDEQRWHYKFTPHYYRTIFTSLMRNSEPGLKDHWVAYLRGDGDKEIMDLYTKIPREKVRKRYLEVIKPLNV